MWPSTHRIDPGHAPGDVVRKGPAAAVGIGSTQACGHSRYRVLAGRSDGIRSTQAGQPGLPSRGQQQQQWRARPLLSILYLTGIPRTRQGKGGPFTGVRARLDPSICESGLPQQGGKGPSWRRRRHPASGDGPGPSWRRRQAGAGVKLALAPASPSGTARPQPDTVTRTPCPRQPQRGSPSGRHGEAGAGPVVNAAARGGPARMLPIPRHKSSAMHVFD